MKKIQTDFIREQRSKVSKMRSFGVFGTLALLLMAVAGAEELPVRLPGARLGESLRRESLRVAGEGERWLAKRGEAVGEAWGVPMRKEISDAGRARMANYLRGLAGQGFFNDAPKDYPMCVWGWAAQLLDALPPSLLTEAGVPTGWRAVAANQVISRQRSDGGWGTGEGMMKEELRMKNEEWDVLETRWAVWTLRRIAED